MYVSTHYTHMHMHMHTTLTHTHTHTHTKTRKHSHTNLKKGKALEHSSITICHLFCASQANESHADAQQQQGLFWPETVCLNIQRCAGDEEEKEAVVFK